MHLNILTYELFLNRKIIKINVLSFTNLVNTKNDFLDRPDDTLASPRNNPGSIPGFSIPGVYKKRDPE